MRTIAVWLHFSFCVLASVACHDDASPPASGADLEASTMNAPARVEQIAPPIDLQRPPEDAVRTKSGLLYKTVVSSAGPQAKPDQIALVHYTGWIQRTGATFFTTRGRNEAIAMDLAHAAPAFAEVLPLVRQGEKIVLWVPPTRGTTEAMVYEIELTGTRSPGAGSATPR